MAPIFGEDGWFKLSFTGWENVPPGPVMFVSNHSGGTVIPDVWGMMFGWVQHFGVDRIVHPLAHDMVFSVPALAQGAARLGILRATPGMGEKVLTEWKRDLFVCPGGDRDTWRPWSERYRVHFAGRKGYAKLALKAGVPVIPIAHAGAHETLMVLTDGRSIARRMRLQKYFRAEIFPIHLSIPWGLAVGPMPHLPMPAHLRYRFGAPVIPPTWDTGSKEPPAVLVDAFDQQVQAAIQDQLDLLREERPSMRARATHIHHATRNLVRRVRA